MSALGHALAALLFLSMAALQWNDPDPVLWVVVYLAITAEMSGDRPYVESAREFLGAAMGAACLGYYWSWHVHAESDDGLP